MLVYQMGLLNESQPPQPPYLLNTSSLCEVPTLAVLNELEGQ